MTRLVLGSLSIETDVANGKVVDARVAATMFRGIETILRGRDPRDAWIVAQRICGVCTASHAIASVRAVESALGMTPPPNARLLRNIVMATHAIADHAGGVVEPADAIHAILGGKKPHPQTFVGGGMATPIDPDRAASIHGGTLGALREQIAKLKNVARAELDPRDAAYGAGPGNYLSFGEYAEDDTLNPKLLFRAGVIRGRDLAKVDFPEIAKIVEAAPKHGFAKRPRYDGVPMETGPLARMLVAYAGGEPDVKSAVDATLAKWRLPFASLHSTFGRNLARNIEMQLLADRLGAWLDELAHNIASGELRIADTKKWEPSTWPKSASGFGFHEAPRGALMHSFEMRDAKVASYDVIAPSTWNLVALEHALAGVSEADVLPTIRSFAPCVPCATH